MFVERRPGRKRRVGAVADPAREDYCGGLGPTPELACPILEGNERCIGGENVRLIRAPAPVRGLDGGDLQLDLLLLLGNDAGKRLHVVSIEPGQSGITLNRRGRGSFLGGRLFGLAIEALRAQLALFAAGQLLHHADAPHGHEIAPEAELVRTGDGKIVDSQLEHGVGQLAGRQRHFPRCGGRSVLRRELPRALDRATLCVFKRERLRQCRRMGERHAGTTEPVSN